LAHTLTQPSPLVLNPRSKGVRFPNLSDSPRVSSSGPRGRAAARARQLTAIFNYNIRLATATGLFPNVEYHELGRL